MKIKCTAYKCEHVTRVQHCSHEICMNFIGNCPRSQSGSC